MRKLVELSWTDRLVLMKVTVLLVSVRIGLRIFRFGVIRSYFDRGGRLDGSRSIDNVDAAYIRSVVWAARAAGRRLLRDKPCLPQALVVNFLLQRAGMDTTLKIGVLREAPEEIQAHAWVVHEGRILIGGTFAPNLYKSLESLGEAA